MNLLKGKLATKPTTCYLMTYVEDRCSANCAFCPQAAGSLSKTALLSRVSWPIYRTEIVFQRIATAYREGTIKRICIQALNYPETFHHLIAQLDIARQKTSVPISVSCQPIKTDHIQQLAKAGAERLSIPLDAANEKLFDKVKGSLRGSPYRWKRQFELLEKATIVFTKGKVSTHLIVGLGETEKNMLNTIQKCVDMNIIPALFAFTPVQGTSMENIPRPKVEIYRRIQLGRYLIFKKITTFKKMRFDSEGRIINFGLERAKLKTIVQTGRPFLTSGCPDCNRPFYNETPRGPLFNYPRELSPQEIAEINGRLGLVAN